MESDGVLSAGRYGEAPAVGLKLGGLHIGTAERHAAGDGSEVFCVASQLALARCSQLG
jgi:hypothetical protein